MWLIIGGAALIAIVTALSVTAVWWVTTDPEEDDG